MQSAETAGGLDYDRFCKSYRDVIRPENYIEVMVSVFRIDAEFREQFRYLKPFLSPDKSLWSDDLVQHLIAQKVLPPGFGHDDIACLRSLYRRHALEFRRGGFDETYLGSIEDVALFFIFHEIGAIHVAGAYRELTARLIGQVCELMARNQRTPVRHIMTALASALTIEVHQIQRCYTLYERHVRNALIADLTYGGILTQFPAGKPAGDDPPATGRSMRVSLTDLIDADLAAQRKDAQCSRPDRSH